MHNLYKRLLFFLILVHSLVQIKHLNFQGNDPIMLQRTACSIRKRETKYIIFLVLDKYFCFTLQKCKTFFKCSFKLTSNIVITMISNSQFICSFFFMKQTWIILKYHFDINFYSSKISGSRLKLKLKCMED